MPNPFTPVDKVAQRVDKLERQVETLLTGLREVILSHGHAPDGTATLAPPVVADTAPATPEDPPETGSALDALLHQSNTA